MVSTKSLLIFFACVLVGAHTTDAVSLKCNVCKRVAGYAYKKIGHRGCGLLTKLEGSSMCELVGFGPEDPAADVCVAVVWKGCDFLLKEIQKGFHLPQHLCRHWCNARSYDYDEYNEIDGDEEAFETTPPYYDYYDYYDGDDESDSLGGAVVYGNGRPTSWEQARRFQSWNGQPGPRI
jgi:hypothetical protein